ncbi:hypothetical protein Tco_0971348 [Tanacetum coccineum]
MTEGSKQSSSVSSDFASKLLILDNVLLVVDEVASMMSVKIRQEESSTQAPPILSVPVTAIPETSTVLATIIPLTIQHQQSTPTPEPTTGPSTNLIPAPPDFSSLFGFDHRVSTLENELSQLKQLDKDLFDSYGNTYSLKRDRDDEDKDEDPFARSDRGLKKRKTSKDAEPTKGPNTKESKSSSSKGTKSQSKSSGKSVQAEEPEFEVADSDMPQNQEGNLGNDDEEPNVASKCDWFTKPKQPQEPTDLIGMLARLINKDQLKVECYKSLSEKLDWNNPEGGDYLFDLTKPLPLVINGNRQIVPVDYFFNNDLKYMQGGILTMTYTNSTTKTKAAQYDLLGIEDMVPNIWSPIKVSYDKHALWGISHWRKQRKTFYAYARGLESSHEVYSTKRILAVTRVEEGDFPRLRINDIEDMLILIVQNRLTNLSGDDVFDFATTLRIFTRSMVIQKRVEHLQLGVKSYQKNINITKPETTRGLASRKRTHTLHIQTLKDSFMFTTKGETDALIMRKASAAVKACQGDSSEFYLITGSNLDGHKVTRSQEGKRSLNDEKRLCLVDDLKEAQIHIQVKPIRTCSSLKLKIIMPYSQDEVKKTNL